MTPPSFLSRIELLTLALGVLGFVAWLALGTMQDASSFLAGAGVGVLNFGAIRLITARLLQSDQQNAQGTAALLLVAKFAVMALVVFLLIVLVGLDAAAFSAGLTTLLVALVAETLRTNQNREIGDSSESAARRNA